MSEPLGPIATVVRAMIYAQAQRLWWPLPDDPFDLKDWEMTDDDRT